MNRKRLLLAQINIGFGLVTLAVGVFCFTQPQYRAIGGVCLLFGALELYAGLTLRRNVLK